MSQRTRTPAALKWTVNELAAVRGEIERIDSEMARLAQRRARLLRVEEAISTVTQSLTEQAVMLDIRPVRASTRYGGRGNLRRYLREALKAAYPRSLSTRTLVEGAQAVFGLSFSSAQERLRFADNNLGNALRKMLARGEVERVHDHRAVPDQPGVWRWKAPAPALEDLRGESGKTADAEAAQWP